MKTIRLLTLTASSIASVTYWPDADLVQGLPTRQLLGVKRTQYAHRELFAFLHDQDPLRTLARLAPLWVDSSDGNLPANRAIRTRPPWVNRGSRGEASSRPLRAWLPARSSPARRYGRKAAVLVATFSQRSTRVMASALGYHGDSKRDRKRVLRASSADPVWVG